MTEPIELLTPSYEKALKTILKQFETFCTQNKLDRVDLDLERNGELIHATWTYHADIVGTMADIYKQFQDYAASWGEAVELGHVEWDEEDTGEEYCAIFSVKKTYKLSV